LKEVDKHFLFPEAKILFMKETHKKGRAPIENTRYMYIHHWTWETPKESSRDQIGKVPGNASTPPVRLQNTFLRSPDFITQESTGLLKLSALQTWGHS
jgi:hypothetical protein